MPTWKPFYDEVARSLLTFEHKQGELLGLLRAMQSAGLTTISLRDKDASGQEIDLAEIDPFTFLATFHRTGDAMRRELWKYLATAWHIAEPTPAEFGGIPTVNPQVSWYFPYAATRQADDVPSLWKLARIAVESPGTLGSALLSRCLRISMVELDKLTSGLFWLNAGAFLPLDSAMCKYLQAQGITWDAIALQSGDALAYRALLKQVNEALGYDYPKIALDAWHLLLDGARPKRFWAGGHDWSIGSQLERFLKDGVWQNGYIHHLNDASRELSPAAKRTLELFEQVKVGDEFAIKSAPPNGTFYLYATGTVSEIDHATRTFHFDPFTVKKRQLPRPVGAGAGNWMDTMLEAKRPQDIEAIFGVNALPQVLAGGEAAPETPQAPEEQEPAVPLPPAPLNQIFYGPPGTGKTYTSIERAVEIILGPDENRDHAAAKREFDRLRRAGRIGFVTFHQSFSYEEFVEGIRPSLDESSAAGARYVCKDGVLKEMALRALGAGLRPVQSGRVTFDDLWNGLLLDVGGNSSLFLNGLREGSRFELSATGDRIEGENILSTSENNVFVCSRSTARTLWESLSHNTSLNSVQVKKQLGRDTGHAGFIAALFNELKRRQSEATLRPDTDTNFVQRARSFLAGSESFVLPAANILPRFVLIVDEINRGNISKILGELITLLEDDKRLGADNALTVTLPYSGEAFALAPNLFLLGTMNTADKSLALLDVALRRRFEFEEMPPRFEVCQNLAPAMRQVLEELNRRLTLARDREHRIGHAYFATVSTPDEFNRVFERKIIPLLQEFFLNDWDGLRAVLGESKASSPRFIRALSGDGSRARTHWQWWTDEAPAKDAPAFSCLDALCLNYGVATAQATRAEPTPQVLGASQDEPSEAA